MLRLIDNIALHYPTLKVTQIFWLFSHCSKRLSHSICPHSPSGPESGKVFQEMARDLKKKSPTDSITHIPIIPFVA